MDYVPNHTSEKHEWFIKSVERIPPYTDYYIWRDAKYQNGKRYPPNNWVNITFKFYHVNRIISKIYLRESK